MSAAVLELGVPTTGRAAAIRLARRRILAGEPLRMQQLAAELGVSRVTLHRWVGGRDELLGEALWSLARRTLDQAERATRARGGRRIGAILGRYVAAVDGAPGMRAFLEREPELALRLLTTRAGPLQARSIAEVERLIGEEIDAGHLRIALPVHDLAYVIVRIVESFLYADVIAGERPDVARARQVVEQLLS